MKNSLPLRTHLSSIIFLLPLLFFLSSAFSLFSYLSFFLYLLFLSAVFFSYTPVPWQIHGCSRRGERNRAIQSSSHGRRLEKSAGTVQAPRDCGGGHHQEAKCHASEVDCRRLRRTRRRCVRETERDIRREHVLGREVGIGKKEKEQY